MDQTQFSEIVSQVVRETADLLRAKGNDYASTKDRLSNFKEAGVKLGLTPYQVLGVYLDKHLCAIAKFISNGKVESEPIEGRINDAINYLILFRGLIEEAKVSQGKSQGGILSGLEARVESLQKSVTKPATPTYDWERRVYGCGCSATGAGPLPSYCGTHPLHGCTIDLVNVPAPALMKSDSGPWATPSYLKEAA